MTGVGSSVATSLIMVTVEATFADSCERESGENMVSQWKCGWERAFGPL